MKKETKREHFLEITFDLVVVIFLFFILFLTLYSIYLDAITTFQISQPKHLITNILVTIILIETYRILMIYLKKHKVSMQHILEVGMVALIQKVVVASDFYELDAAKLFGVAAMMLVLGGLYIAMLLKLKEELL